ncbi:hypothetical protein [uncultured Lutibacter sp.]|uniref:hypothetical protein n=1 Tax=uncultured Lutibacter sp. TaxID=437739 RepID=UPI002628675E|nr:hypothetical protein [uncultured Lutibacter sp.]
MKEKDISKIAENNRLTLTMVELYLHYSPAIVISVVPILNIYFLISSIIRNDQISYDRVIDGIGLPIVLFLISIIIFIIKYKNLEFKTIEIDNDNNRFEKALEFTIKELEWKKLDKSKNYFSGVSESSLIGFGERVTILKKDRLILINSIENPNNILSNFSFGGNRKNIETFKRNLKACV